MCLNGANPSQSQRDPIQASDDGVKLMKPSWWSLQANENHQSKAAAKPMEALGGSHGAEESHKDGAAKQAKR